MKLLFVKFPFGTEMRMSQQNHEGGWSGIGMATVGIHPNDFDLYPNKIPPGRVVQNCPLLSPLSFFYRTGGQVQAGRTSHINWTGLFDSKRFSMGRLVKMRP